VIWLGLSGSVVFGIKSFSLWDQVLILKGEDPILLLARNQIHALRYLLIYPVFEFSGATGLPENGVFDVICIICLLCSFFMIRALDYEMTGRRSKALDLGLTVALCGLAVFMNGRAILAFFGYALLLFSLTPLLDA